MMFVTVDGRMQKYRTNLPGTMKLATMRQLQREFDIEWADVHTFIQSTSDDTPLLKLMTQDKFLLWVWAWMHNAGSEITFAELEQLTADDISFGPDTDVGTVDVGAAGDESPTPAPTSNSSRRDSGRGQADVDGPPGPPAPPAKKAPAKKAPAKTARKRPVKKVAGGSRSSGRSGRR